jgi:DNA-binding response OmpR family regulator
MNTVVLKILIIEDTPERQKILKNLYKDHAWILVHTAERAVKLLSVFKFDLISLDYNLAGSRCGDEIAAFLPASINNCTKILVHSMNKQGADKIKEFLPHADFIPISKMIKTNIVFKKIRTELAKGTDIDWAFVFQKDAGQ